jgi:hypothetical protein
MSRLASRAGRLLGAWDRWWLADVPPHALAAVRIGFGAFLLLYWTLKAPILPAMSSGEGLVMPLLGPDSPAWMTVLFAPPPAWAAWLVYGALLASLTCLTVGIGARAAAGVSLSLYAYEWMLSLHQFNTSFDRLFLFMLLVLLFSPSDRALSLSMRLKHGSWRAWEPAPVTAQRVLAVQIAATYLGVGWQKLILPDWQGGEIIAVGLIGHWATPPAFAIGRLDLPMWAYDAANNAVKLFELTVPFGLWVPRWQWWFFAMGALFHLSIAVLLGIWWFVILIPAYVLFLDPAAVHRFFAARGMAQKRPMEN